MQDDVTGKDKRADIFLSSRMNIWIGCCELEGHYDARPGCSGQSTGEVLEAGMAVPQGSVVVCL